MSLWTAKAAAQATGGMTTGDWVCNGVSIDTRTLEPGDLFVALTAARDGHDFVAQALAAGAGAALVSRIPDGVAPDAPLLVVGDVQKALEDLGRAARARMTGKVVAVTGSVGKTSTKEMLRTVLGGQGRVHASVASYNNHWGVPLTLARMPANTDFAVIEIGMNHPGEIAPLSKMARPHLAMVTIVAAAHLAAFESIEAIAHEKAAIFEGLEADGIAVYNGDLPVSWVLREKAEAYAGRLLSFGEDPSNHHRLFDVKVGEQNTVGTLRGWRTPILFKVAAPGRHFAVNSVGALAVAHALGLDRAIAVTDLGRWAPGAGRGLRETIYLDPVDSVPRLELIDDAYNANPASMAAALEVLAGAEVQHGIGRFAQGRKIAYLGDMKELGKTEVEIHQSLAKLEAMEQIDRVHCIGPLMRHLHKALPAQKRGRWTETSAEMIEGIARDLDAGDVVLAKGSLSTGVGRVVDAIKKFGHPDPNENEGT